MPPSDRLIEQSAAAGATPSVASTGEAAAVFERYQAVRHRLPRAARAGSRIDADDLGVLAAGFDAFVFDAFGVLNVGARPIAGARERIAALRAAGKQVLVLTNAATGPLSRGVDKYRSLGFDFSAAEIVSSREILAGALARRDPGRAWGVVAPAESEVEELPGAAVRLTLDDAPWPAVDGFVLLSTQDLQAGLIEALGEALRLRPRPVLVGNPDLVAPRETGFSLEPGWYAHALADDLGIEPEFYGKPFANAFAQAVHRLGRAIKPERIAMVGDTLHTDILGGAAAGIGTVLVTGHGVLKDLDVDACIDRSGIVPDYVVPGI